MSDDEKRIHSRTMADIVVEFCEDSENSTNQQYQKGLVENCSAGGMYITTEIPATRGSTIRLKFSLGSSEVIPLPVQARAVVRWVRYVSQPHGMGVEFLEFKGIDAMDFKEWATSLLGS